MAEDISNKEVAKTIADSSAKQTASLEKAIVSLQKQQLELDVKQSIESKKLENNPDAKVGLLELAQERIAAKDAHADAQKAHDDAEKIDKDIKEAQKANTNALIVHNDTASEILEAGKKSADEANENLGGVRKSMFGLTKLFSIFKRSQPTPAEQKEKDTKEGFFKKKQAAAWASMKNMSNSMLKSMTKVGKISIMGLLGAAALFALIKFLDSEKWQEWKKKLIPALMTGLEKLGDMVKAVWGWLSWLVVDILGPTVMWMKDRMVEGFKGFENLKKDWNEIWGDADEFAGEGGKPLEKNVFKKIGDSLLSLQDNLGAIALGLGAAGLVGALAFATIFKPFIGAGLLLTGGVWKIGKILAGAFGRIATAITGMIQSLRAPLPRTPVPGTGAAGPAGGATAPKPTAGGLLGTKPLGPQPQHTKLSAAKAGGGKIKAGQFKANIHMSPSERRAMRGQSGFYQKFKTLKAIRAMKVPGLIGAALSLPMLYSIWDNAELDVNEKKKRTAGVLGGVLGSAVGASAFATAASVLIPGIGQSLIGNALIGLAGGTMGWLYGKELGEFVADWLFGKKDKSGGKGLVGSAGLEGGALGGGFFGMDTPKKTMADLGAWKKPAITSSGFDMMGSDAAPTSIHDKVTGAALNRVGVGARSGRQGSEGAPQTNVVSQQNITKVETKSILDTSVNQSVGDLLGA